MKTAVLGGISWIENELGNWVPDNRFPNDLSHCYILKNDMAAIEIALALAAPMPSGPWRLQTEAEKAA